MLDHMKFVATANFRDGTRHIAKGEVVSYDDEKVIGQLQSAGRLADVGSDEARNVEAEVAADRKREKRNKREPWTLDRRLKLLAIIISLLGLAYLVWRSMQQ